MHYCQCQLKNATAILCMSFTHSNTKSEDIVGHKNSTISFKTKT